MALQEVVLANGKKALVHVVDNDRKFPLTDWDDPDLHPATYGVSSAYIPIEYPKAVYTSYTTHIKVNSKEEEDAALAAGGSLTFLDFPAPVEIEEGNELATLKRQVLAMQEMLSQAAQARNTQKAKEAKS